MGGLGKAHKHTGTHMHRKHPPLALKSAQVHTPPPPALTERRASHSISYHRRLHRDCNAEAAPPWDAPPPPPLHTAHPTPVRVAYSNGRLCRLECLTPHHSSKSC